MVGGGSRMFQVAGSHTYTGPGPYTVQVTVTNVATQAEGSAQGAASSGPQAIADGTRIIATFAGGGTPADGLGDGGAATSAQLTGPKDVSVDGRGNVYIVDFSVWRVRRVDTNGNIKTYAGNGTNENKCGGGPATQVGFDLPRGVAADGAGHVYVTDYLCGLISRIEPDPSPGNLLTVVAGSLCLGVGPQGCLFGLSPDGKPANTPATQTELSQPAGVAVAVDQAGMATLYIAQPGSNLIRVVYPQSTIGLFAGQWDGQPTLLNGVAGRVPNRPSRCLAPLPDAPIAPCDLRIYIVDTGNNVVRVVSTRN
jgi:hypothetical protein